VFDTFIQFRPILIFVHKAGAYPSAVTYRAPLYGYAPLCALKKQNGD